LIGKHLAKKYEHLPIDTKYFKDLELEILSQFEDLDKSLDGWLIKSENYQALNTILPKFKEKVQTIYIDPPFNLDSSDQFLYRTNYKDANWATLLENRIRIAKEWLNEKGSIFVRCDYNGNWIVRNLLDDIFENNFVNEIDVGKTAGKKKTGLSLAYTKDNILFYAKDLNLINETIKETDRYLFYKEIISLLDKQKLENKEKISDLLLNSLFWLDLDHRPGERQTNKNRYLLGIEFQPPKGRHWIKSQEKLDELYQNGKARIKDKIKGTYYYKKEDIPNGIDTSGLVIQVFLDTEIITDNWTDVNGYSQTHDFQTENSEILLKRVIETGSNVGEFIYDFFLGSGTTTAVAHKLGRKWIGVEMGEHFYTVVLPRMKKVLAYDKSGISKEVKEYKGGGFFKYYELEQYEEALANCKYEDGDLFSVPGRSPYQEYVFLKDDKMLKVLEIDYENNKVKVDLDKLYQNIDIAETLSNLTGKWIKKIKEDEVEFEDGTKINTKDLDYKLFKPLIWWE
jgi:adenine specific DNA methylase Mod